MRQLDDIRRIDFLGIGGIGMSALARYFQEKGVLVSGYDRTPSPLTRTLEAEGIVVRYEATPVKDPDLVVYTPAIPASLPLMKVYQTAAVPMLKRSQVLGLITREMYCITVGGTHGKTTVSAFIAHILRESGYGCNAFLGGILVNYGTNFWSSSRPTAVVEADEYDRSFLELSPDVAVVTAMDPDHLDIYGTESAMQDAYVSYTNLIRPGGTLVYKYQLPRVAEMGGSRKISYSLSAPAANCHATDIRIVEGAYHFGIATPEGPLTDLSLTIGGLHNIENAVAASTVARGLGIPDEAIRAAVGSFRGTKRRFEYIIRNDRNVYIDDYAHHPEELRALLASARDLFPDRPCTIIFQPHLFSRTRDLAEAFAGVLDAADEIILLPVYPAREAPIPGVDSGLIAARMKHPGVRLLTPEETLERIARLRPALLITAGAGDIDRMVDELGQILRDVEKKEEIPTADQKEKHSQS